MEAVFVCIALGIGVGVLLRNKTLVLSWIERGTLVAVLVLLFLMGIAIGNNNEVMLELRQVGVIAGLVTLASITGSVAMAWVAYRIWLKMRR